MVAPMEPFRSVRTFPPEPNYRDTEHAKMNTNKDKKREVLPNSTWIHRAAPPAPYLPRRVFCTKPIGYESFVSGDLILCNKIYNFRHPPGENMIGCL